MMAVVWFLIRGLRISLSRLYALSSLILTTHSQQIQIFQDNYPEFLSEKLFINIPTVYSFVYNLMTSFSAKNTVKKFHLITANSVRKELFNRASVLDIPERYGGFTNSDKWNTETIYDVVIAARSKKTVAFDVFPRDTISIEFYVVEGTIKVTDTLNAEKSDLAEGTDGKIERVVDKAGKMVVAFDNTGLLTDKRVLFRVKATEGR